MALQGKAYFTVMPGIGPDLGSQIIRGQKKKLNR